MLCRYNMPFLAVQLNQASKELAKVLPPTDSRRRADLQALEKGLIDEVMHEVYTKNMPCTVMVFRQTLLTPKALYWGKLAWSA